MGDGSEFRWAVLPTWRASYPRRYLGAVGAAALALTSAVGAALGWSWAMLVLGASLGGAFGVHVGVRRVEVRAGRIHGLARDGAIPGDRVLAVEHRRGPVADCVEILVVGVDRPIRIGSLVSWRAWPDPGFPDRVRRFRSALGMSPDPVAEVGAPPRPRRGVHGQG